MTRWKKLKKILMDKQLRETTNLGVEIMNSKRQVKRKLGHVVQIRVWFFKIYSRNYAAGIHGNYRESSDCFEYPSLCSRCLEVVGKRKNGRARRRHARGEGACLPQGRPFSLSPTTSKHLLRRLWIPKKSLLPYLNQATKKILAKFSHQKKPWNRKLQTPKILRSSLSFEIRVPFALLSCSLQIIKIPK